MPDATGATSMLEIRNAEVRYGSATALWDVSLRVDAGELVCVVGPNGAGKTTLINLIAGLSRLAAGSMTFGAIDLKRTSPHRFCSEGIALVPEGRRLFTGMTVRENLLLGGYRSGVREERSRMLDRVCGMFPAIAAKLDRLAGSLSGGQQQMVAIARALMAKPRLLLLDEPSLGLAPAIVLDMFTIIRTINAERVAVLLVEQNVAMALNVASRAYVLEEGRIVAEGLPETLMAQPEIRRAYLGLGADS